VLLYQQGAVIESADTKKSEGVNLLNDISIN